MPSVFISHSTLDREPVERAIIAPLREHGIVVWYSKDSIETADEWERKIKDGLKSCDWFLVVMSPRSVASKWVQREVFWAVDKREGRIIPIMLETCEPEDLNLALLPMQYIDFRQDLKLAQKKLLSRWGLDKVEQINNLSYTAETALASQDWATAVTKLEELLRLKPTHAEAQSQLGYARQQQELAHLYAEGLNCFHKRQWQEALVWFHRVRAIQRGYRDVPDLIAQAAAELNRLQQKQREPEAQGAIVLPGSPVNKDEDRSRFDRPVPPSSLRSSLGQQSPNKLPNRRKWLKVTVIAALAVILVGGLLAGSLIVIGMWENRQEQIRERESERASIARSIPPLIPISPGRFLMGTESGRNDEKPHSVMITNSFLIGKYEVTQAQWQAVMGSNPSLVRGDNLPVERVTWNEAQEFIKRLNQISDEYIFRLPTEAEWEYACRAGKSGDDAGDMNSLAWFKDNSGSGPRSSDQHTHPIGTKQPNALGIYDMLGNVGEWCEDWYGYDYYKSSPRDDPKGPTTGNNRVVRGGSYAEDINGVRSAYRGRLPQVASAPTVGFRVAANLKRGNQAMADPSHADASPGASLENASPQPSASSSPNATAEPSPTLQSERERKKDERFIASLNGARYQLGSSDYYFEIQGNRVLWFQATLDPSAKGYLITNRTFSIPKASNCSDGTKCDGVGIITEDGNAIRYTYTPTPGGTEVTHVYRRQLSKP